MAFLTKLLEVGGPISILIAVVIVVLLVAIKILWENLKEEKEHSRTVIKESTDKYENIVKEMFEVINRNTNATVLHTEAASELKDSMRELRIALSQDNIPK